MNWNQYKFARPTSLVGAYAAIQLCLSASGCRLRGAAVGRRCWHIAGGIEIGQLRANPTFVSAHAIQMRHRDERAKEGAQRYADSDDDRERRFELPRKDRYSHDGSVLDREDHRSQHQQQYEEDPHARHVPERQLSQSSVGTRR